VGKEGGLFPRAKMRVVKDGGCGQRGGRDGRGRGGWRGLREVLGSRKEVIVLGGGASVGQPELARDRVLHGGKRQEPGEG